jgi:hypothetical protein
MPPDDDSLDAATAKQPRERTAQRRKPPTNGVASNGHAVSDASGDSGITTFTDSGDSNAPTSRSPNRQTTPKPDELRKRLAWHVCPFCGNRNQDGKAECPACGMEDHDLTRTATTRRVGPWFLRQTSNPFAPGMKFTVLRELTKQGRVNPDSVVRGPTTRQMWTFAARVRGLAHLFGICWNCNRTLPAPGPNEDPDDFCLYCGALIEPPSNPDQQLEVAETSESLGMKGADGSGQVAKGSSRSKSAEERGLGKRKVTIGAKSSDPTSSTSATPAPARRRVMPGATREAADGSDSLLTTGELATAFNLDRKTGFWHLIRRLPLAWIAVVLLLASLVAGVFLYGVSEVVELVRDLLGT